MGSLEQITGNMPSFQEVWEDFPHHYIYTDDRFTEDRKLWSEFDQVYYDTVYQNWQEPHEVQTIEGFSMPGFFRIDGTVTVDENKVFYRGMALAYSSLMEELEAKVSQLMQRSDQLQPEVYFVSDSGSPFCDDLTPEYLMSLDVDQIPLETQEDLDCAQRLVGELQGLKVRLDIEMKHLFENFEKLVIASSQIVYSYEAFQLDPDEDVKELIRFLPVAEAHLAQRGNDYQKVFFCFAQAEIEYAKERNQSVLFESEIEENLPDRAMDEDFGAFVSNTPLQDFYFHDLNGTVVDFVPARREEAPTLVVFLDTHPNVEYNFSNTHDMVLL